MKVVPLGDRIVIKPDEGKEVTEGGIIIPNNSIEKPSKGLVISVGYGHREHGELIPVAVQPGAKVFYAKYGGNVIDDGYIILREDDILAVIEE